MKVKVVRFVIRLAGVFSLVILLVKLAVMLGMAMKFEPDTEHIIGSIVGVLIWLEAEWSWHKRTA